MVRVIGFGPKVDGVLAYECIAREDTSVEKTGREKSEPSCMKRGNLVRGAYGARYAGRPRAVASHCACYSLMAPSCAVVVVAGGREGRGGRMAVRRAVSVATPSMRSRTSDPLAEGA